MTSAPPDPAGLDASKQMRARLRDMEAHLDQYTPAVVTGADGRVYLAMASMLPGQVDLEPYPFLTPQSRLDNQEPGTPNQETQSLDFTNAAAIARIEDRLNEYGIHSPPDADGQTILGRMNPAGFQGHDFQVLWLGSRPNWLVLPGTVAWHERAGAIRETTSQRVFLQAVHGWIVLPLTITLDEYDGAPPGYTIDVGLPKITTTPRQSPPIRSTSFTGEGADGILVETRTYGVGRYDFPLAYVEPPGANRKSPLIHPWRTRAIRAVLGTTWPGAFPGLF